MASAAVRPQERESRAESVLARGLAYGGALFVALLICAALLIEPGSVGDLGPETLVWALVASIAGLSAIDLGPDKPALSMDLPVLLACAFSEGPTEAGVVAFIGTFDQFELRGQSTFPRIAWNHAQTALSVMAAGWVFHFAGGLELGLPLAVVAAVGGLAADVAVNYSSVAVLQAAISGRRVSEIAAAMKIGTTPGFAASYLAFGLLSLLIAFAFQAFGFGGVLVCIAPLILAREAFTNAVHVEQESIRVANQAQALALVDERIADERHDERAQIAAALHDDVLQCLYNVNLRAQVIREDLRSGRLLQLEDDVPALLDAADAASRELRDVIHGLRRSPIGRTGLTDTVTLLANHLRDESGINFVLKLESLIGIPADVELLAYQLLREAMMNAARHSRADSIWVSIRREESWLVLECVDNGVGFDVKAGNDGRRHFGIPLMRERATLGGGTVEIRTRVGGGVTISARLPLR